ncbi:hypothetical protein C8Q76DRAFT_860730 [Earliella scabrosa]|nr:hypothetical protein C8Q76DRAFT_860730 [Earliella scabrosa]
MFTSHVPRRRDLQARPPLPAPPGGEATHEWETPENVPDIQTSTTRIFRSRLESLGSDKLEGTFVLADRPSYLTDRVGCGEQRDSRAREFYAVKLLGLLRARASSEKRQTEDSADGLDDFTSYETYETRENVPESPDIDDLPLETVVVPPDTLVSTLMRRLRHDVSQAGAEGARRRSGTPAPTVWSKTRTSECKICERAVAAPAHVPPPPHLIRKLEKKWHRTPHPSTRWHVSAGGEQRDARSRAPSSTSPPSSASLLLAREAVQKWPRYAAKPRFGRTAANNNSNGRRRS